MAPPGRGAVASTDAIDAIVIIAGRLPPAAAEDERHVHLVGLVVEAGGVHGQVDAQAEGHLALRVAAGEHLVLPLPEVVARPGPAEIVLRVDDQRRAPVVDDAFEARHRQHAARPASAAGRTTCRPRGRRRACCERLLREQARARAARTDWSKAPPGVAVGAVDDEEAAGLEVTPQARHVLLGRRRKARSPAR